MSVSKWESSITKRLLGGGDEGQWLWGAVISWQPYPGECDGYITPTVSAVRKLSDDLERLSGKSG